MRSTFVFVVFQESACSLTWFSFYLQKRFETSCNRIVWVTRTPHEQQPQRFERQLSLTDVSMSLLAIKVPVVGGGGHCGAQNSRCVTSARGGWNRPIGLKFYHRNAFRTPNKICSNFVPTCSLQCVQPVYFTVNSLNTCQQWHDLVGLAESLKNTHYYYRFTNTDTTESTKNKTWKGKIWFYRKCIDTPCHSQRYWIQHQGRCCRCINSVVPYEISIAVWGA